MSCSIVAITNQNTTSLVEIQEQVESTLRDVFVRSKTMDENYCNCNRKTGNFYVEESYRIPLTAGIIEGKYIHDHQELISFTYDSDRHVYVYIFAEVYN